MEMCLFFWHMKYNLILRGAGAGSATWSTSDICPVDRLPKKSKRLPEGNDGAGGSGTSMSLHRSFHLQAVETAPSLNVPRMTA
eukprot:6745653-Karenia_brevis.AAC.1